MFNIFETKEVDGKLVVSIEVPLGERLGPTRVAIRTKHLIKMLADKKVKHGACIKESYVTGWREHTRRGEWVFELPKKAPAKKAPKAKAAPKPKAAPKAE